MSTLIAKPSGVPFLEKDVWGEIIFKEPLYVGLAYAKDGQIHVEKYIEEENKKDSKIIDAAFRRLETLTDFNVVVFFEHKKTKVFRLTQENIPPIVINDKLVYVAAGEILSLTKEHKKIYSDAFYMKDYLFNPVLAGIPDLFYSYSGAWLLEKFIPGTSALVFLNADGKGDDGFSVIHHSKGEIFNKMWCFDTEYYLPKEKLLKKVTPRFWP